jgi:RHS repeat-associated protein
LGPSRSFDNVFHPSYNGINGVNWYSHHVPHLIAHGKGVPTTLVLMTSPREALWFDRVGATGNYAARFDHKSTIVYDSSSEDYVVTGESGNKTLFYSFAVPDMGGMFKGLLNANGLPSLASYDSLHRLVSLETSSDGKTSGFYYKYSPGQKSPGKLESVTLTVNGVCVRRALYTYYASGDAHGLPWDLKNAVIEQYDSTNAIWTKLRTSYYRYYTANCESGYNHGLQCAVGAEAHARLVASGITPETATDEQLRGYADYYFEYDWKRRVTLERVKGGGYTYAFQYESNPAPGKGFNAWTTKTTETLPDGTQNIAYANVFAQVIVKINQTGGQQWGKHYQFDNKGRQLLAADPSAISGYDESTPSVAKLHPKTGLVRTSEYYPENAPGGQPYGYLRYERIQEGSAGKPVLLKEYRYAPHSVGYEAIYPISQAIKYQSDSGDLAPAITQYTYDKWYQIDGVDTFQIQQRTTIMPVVPTEQNGSGAANSFTEVFDQYERRTWLKDARGFLTATTNDPVTGALMTQIQDVNSAIAPAPNGWTTPEGGGLHLVSDFEFDDLGRETQSLGPVHEVDIDGVATSVRNAAWTVYADDTKQTLEASGYATGEASKYAFTLINPVKITTRDQLDRVIEVVSATRADRNGALSASDSFPQSSYSRWKRTTYDDQKQIRSQRVYFLIPQQGFGESGVNYNETRYGYDARGRQNQIVQPSGTVQRTVYDSRGLAISNWTGTNDTAATDGDPAGGGAVGNNMRAVSVQQYDGGAAGGAGNLTQVSLPVDDSAANNRVTTYGYDHRRRRVSDIRTDGTTKWNIATTYDNQDRPVQASTSVVGGRLVSQSRTCYDNCGQVYRQETDGVDPGTGSVVNTLASQNWYDLRGNIIKASKAGGASFTKTVFDSLNRRTHSFIACVPGAAGVPSGCDNDVSSDTVIEQNETIYDAAGNIILQIRRQRLDNASGTGPLQNVSAEPKARVSYTASWLDAAGRVRATANYGTNGGATLVRPPTAPARSDTVLVTTRRFKNDGEANAIIDPMGLETRWENDQAGRRVRLTENYVEGGGQNSRVSLYAWHPSGQLEKLTLQNSVTGDQVTRWVFGSTLKDSGVADNNLLRAKIYPESDNEGSPLGNGPKGVYDRIEYTYNRHGDTVTFRDADETVHAYAHDKLKRLVSDSVTALGAGLDASVRRIERAYEDHGQLKTVTSFDAPVGGSIVNQVAFAYDAFGNLIADRQSHAGPVAAGVTPQVAYVHSAGDGNSTRRNSAIYPSGRMVNISYGLANSIDEKLNRVTALNVTGESANLVEYTYAGLGWQVRVGYPVPNLALDYRQTPGEPAGDGDDPYVGYDRFGRTVDMRWLNAADNSSIERIQYGYDRNSRRASRVRQGLSSDSVSYSYDDLNQVVNASGGGSPGSAQTESWSYDPTGNWSRYTASGAVTVDQTRVHDRDNRLIQIGNDANTVVLDRAGRMLHVPPDASGDWSQPFDIIWDAWSRVVRVSRNGAVLGAYAYDGLTRRTTRAAAGVIWHTYYSDAWRPLEERRDSQSSPSILYLWGVRHRDDLVRRDRATAKPGNLDETRYVLMDYFSPVAITGPKGDVTERYAFSPFGLRTVLDKNGSIRATSESDWTFAFQGQFVDIESAFMDYGYRYYSVRLGTWLSRDPIEEKGGVNLYSFADNDGVGKVDHLGLVPALEAPKTVAGPTAGNCGQFTWTIQWLLNINSDAGGWIIQNVSVAFSVTDCDDDAIDVKKATSGAVDPAWWPLWEAWEVAEGSNTTTYADAGDVMDDTYAMPSFGDCTRGTITITGSADYYEGLTLPSSFVATDKPPAYILPSTQTNPNLGAGSGAVQHSVTLSWNCCPSDDDDTTTYTTTP